MPRHRSSALYGAGIMGAYFLLMFNTHICIAYIVFTTITTYNTWFFFFFYDTFSQCITKYIYCFLGLLELVTLYLPLTLFTMLILVQLGSYTIYNFNTTYNKVLTLLQYNRYFGLFLWFYFYIFSIISLHVNFKIYIGAIYRNHNTYLWFTQNIQTTLHYVHIQGIRLRRKIWRRRW